MRYLHIWNLSSSETQGKLVETIECSWWKFTVKRSPRTFYRPDLLPLGLRGWESLKPKSTAQTVSGDKLSNKIMQNFLLFFFFSNWDYSHTNYKQKRCKYWVLTIYIRKVEFLPEKSNGSHRYPLESSENVDFVLRRCNFLLLSDFSSDFDILCSELFLHHD